ncbi:hypothetical protein D065_10364 [Streptococcus mitis 13/39]|uniref:Uncharacterized protein n=1 Tax=Streptococcus mitis 13/39 TaxID=1239793 RepID=R0M9J0_STRMT|nr:hypothetical protein D065_10364 [Streptococcus mitis 13/39]
MTLQQIKAQIYNLGTYKQQKIEAYGKMKKELLEKVRDQVLYQSEAELRWRTLKKRPISTQILSLPIF